MLGISRNVKSIGSDFAYKTAYERAGRDMSPIDEDHSNHTTGQGKAPLWPEDDDDDDFEEEDLEAVVVHNMESSLHRIHRIEARCERGSGITRQKSMDFLAATLGYDGRSSSPASMLPTVPGSPAVHSQMPTTPDANPEPLRLDGLPTIPDSKEASPIDLAPASSAGLPTILGSPANAAADPATPPRRGRS